MKIQLKCFIIVTLFFSQSFIIPTISADEIDTQTEENTLKIALLLQRWDYLDLLVLAYIVPFYLIRLSQLRLRYNIKTNFKIYWDNLQGGDVQDGKLLSENIDIAIAPGGMGSFYTPEPYRNQLKTFVENGGGFFAICADCYYGTQGYINASENFDDVLFKLFEYDEISPPLNLSPVYCDVELFTEVFPNESTENNIYFMLVLFKLIFANSLVEISNTPIPFAEKYQGKKLFIETGVFPLVLNTSQNQENTTILGRFIKSRSPFNDSLIDGKIAIIASTYKNGRVILSPIHTEVSFFRFKAHDIFFESILWLAKLK